MKRFRVYSAMIFCACAVSASAQNTVVFDNQSGEPALVRLIGPTSREIQVPTSAKRSLAASAGLYHIKVRYGILGEYRYAKGEEFELTEAANTRSETSITLHKAIGGDYKTVRSETSIILHKVTGGDYKTVPISEREFESRRPQQDAQKNGKASQPKTDLDQLLPLFVKDTRLPDNIAKQYEVLALFSSVACFKKEMDSEILGSDILASVIIRKGGIYLQLTNFAWKPKIPEKARSIRLLLEHVDDARVVMFSAGNELWKYEGADSEPVLSPEIDVPGTSTRGITIKVESIGPKAYLGVYGGVVNIYILKAT